MNDLPDQDSRVLAWLAVARHPFFHDCYQTDGTLLDAVLAKLDAARAHTCDPVWRPVYFEEIQPGWEVRTRRRDGSEVSRGNACHQDDDGDWYTEAGAWLTSGARVWTYETTAPEPEPGQRGGGLRRPRGRLAIVTTLTPETLAELRLLLDDAPPLPYRASPRAHGDPSGGPTYVALEAQLEGRWEEVATGCYDLWSDMGLALAAAAINALPALLAAADEFAHMKEARDNARAEVERLTATVGLGIRRHLRNPHSRSRSRSRYLRAASNSTNPT